MDAITLYIVRIWREAKTYDGIFKDGETYTDLLYKNEDTAKQTFELLKDLDYRVEFIVS